MCACVCACTCGGAGGGWCGGVCGGVGGAYPPCSTRQMRCMFEELKALGGACRRRLSAWQPTAHTHTYGQRTAAQLLLEMFCDRVTRATRSQDLKVPRTFSLLYPPVYRYRTVEEDVPVGDYELPLGVARLARGGTDVTLVGWGQQVRVLERAVRVS